MFVIVSPELCLSVTLPPESAVEDRELSDDFIPMPEAPALPKISSSEIWALLLDEPEMLLVMVTLTNLSWRISKAISFSRSTGTLAFSGVYTSERGTVCRTGYVKAVLA